MDKKTKFSPEMGYKILELAKKHGLTPAEVIRKGPAYYLYMEDRAKLEKIGSEKKDGK